VVHGSYGVGVWKEWRDLSKFVRYEVGDGLKIQFWYGV
jgi:hypothetical protein